MGGAYCDFGRILTSFFDAKTYLQHIEKSGREIIIVPSPDGGFCRWIGSHQNDDTINSPGYFEP